MVPPSTNRFSPMMKDESSLTRNRIALAASSGWPGRASMFSTGRGGSNSSRATGERADLVGHDRVHPDPVGRELHRERPGEIGDRPLGGRIRDGAAATLP